MAEPVTMAEIDALRGEAADLLDGIRRARGAARVRRRGRLALRRVLIEKLLRRWWAQGCRELP